MLNFADNTIRILNGLLVKACPVEGLNVSDNKMIFSGDYRKAEEGEAIKLEYCDKVEIKDNLAKGVHPQTTDTGQVTVGKNTGFEAQEKNLKSATK